MPMCIAMLQNQAKNMTCQKVNFTWPGSGSPPFQIDVWHNVPDIAERLDLVSSRRQELPQANRCRTR